MTNTNPDVGINIMEAVSDTINKYNDVGYRSGDRVKKGYFRHKFTGIGVQRNFCEILGTPEDPWTVTVQVTPGPGVLVGVLTETNSV